MSGQNQGGWTAFSGRVKPTVIVSVGARRVAMSPGTYKVYRFWLNVATGFSELYRDILRAWHKITRRGKK